MNKRIMNVEISINGIKTVRLEDATQGDKNTHFFDLVFTNDIELEGYELQVYYLPPFPATVPLVDTFSNPQKSMQIVIPPNALKRNGEVTVEFALSKNNELITINRNLTFEVVKTTNGTSLTAYPEGTLKETISQQIEKIKNLLAQTDGKINEYNQNATEKTTSFNNNYDEKLKAFNSNDVEKTSTFNDNAAKKLKEYNDNDTSKMEIYNNNADSKLKTYNDNDNLKTKEYNQNASAKFEEYNNNHAQKIEESLSNIDEYVNNNSKVDIDKYVISKENELKGATYTPAVDKAGNLSFTNDKNLPNPPVVNIMGPEGKQGKPGEKGDPAPAPKFRLDGTHLIMIIEGGK